MKISVVIPSRTRPARLLECVKRLYETTQGHDVECVIVIDQDPESRDLLAQNTPALVIHYDGQVGAIACWNRGLREAHGDIIVFAADDLWWEAGWLEAALQAHREKLNGYGVVGFNDGHQDGNLLSTHFLLDRKFCVQHMNGVLAYPVYHFYCNDSETNCRAKRLGCFVWCRESRVNHEHYTYQARDKDDLDKWNHRWAGEDHRLFEQRAAAGFPDNFDRVLPLEEAG